MLKRPLADREIFELETATERPSGIGPPLRKVTNEHYQLDVAGLYWGLHRMLHNLFADAGQRAASAGMAGRFRAL